MATPNALIFVYGTLKEGFGNNRLIQASANNRKVCDAVTKNSFYFLSSGIPYIQRNNRFIEDFKAPVTGELYSVDDITLERMDALEGHPTWYRREDTIVVDAEGIEHPCQAYFYQPPIIPQLPIDGQHTHTRG